MRELTFTDVNSKSKKKLSLFNKTTSQIVAPVKMNKNVTEACISL